MLIVGLLGYNGAGKDTVANYLISQYGFKKLSFGGALKDAVAAIFGWPRHLLEGDTDESRLWREQIDQYWNDTPRKILETFGTELCRKHFDSDLWIKSLYKTIKTQPNDAKIIITDCRFDNEIQLIQSLNGILIRIERDPMPDWYPFITQYQQQKISKQQAQLLLQNESHCSQWLHYFCDIQPNYCLFNNSTIEELHSKIEAVMSSVNSSNT
jgi:hypothetical protein